jgi:hypothetical protein
MEYWMQIKHTFLFTLCLGIVWTGYLFAYVLGPDPAMNGIFGTGQTCATSGCHTGNAVNAAGGSLTIGGLPPAGWTPGETYPLTVTIQRTGARLFGFQLSAVADATNQQAGTLTAGHSRVQIICGRGAVATSTLVTSCSTAGAIQYAEHNNAQIVTSTYLVNWTAPSSASVGTVRFNIAGNAANGDLTNQGDFIYTRVERVDPASAPPPPPPPDLSTRAFTMVDRAGVSVITDGSGDLSVGYSRIQPDAGSTTPSGVAIFGFRPGGVLVTEAGVPASSLLTSARIYAEVNGPVNTGIAIANPNDEDAGISFHFTNSAGVDFGGGGLTIGPNQQIARFLDQEPFNGGASVQGTLTVSSNRPVSMIALRGFTNERGEFLITTLPVSDLPGTPANGTVYLPHFADGGGWTTQIILVNPTDSPITGSVQFFGQGSLGVNAAALTVTANGQTATTFNYSIPRQSSFKFVTAGIGSSTQAGSVRVTPATGVAPSSLVVFSFKPAGVTVSEAGVPGIQGSAFRMYAEETAAGGIGAIQTGLAIANLTSSEAAVTLELSHLDGSSTGQTASVAVPGNGQTARFLHELFPGLAFPFSGILRISSGSALSVVGLRGRYNERGDFLITTTPPSNEAAIASGAESLFPHLVNGGGYTTQFILFSGAAGQTSSGNLKFYRQDGTALDLTLN